MSLRSWFRGASSTSSPASGASPVVSASTSTTAIAESAVDKEVADLEDALEATALIMNDDIVGAEARLRRRKDGSSFHLLGLGISTFISSVLGFEKEIMAEATARLLESETRAWADMKKAQKEVAKDAHGNASGRAYPPGSEYALVYAEAELMLAVIAVLHESITEGLKGFYKLRKGYISLNAIMESEVAYLNRRNGTSTVTGDNVAAVLQRLSLSEEEMPGTFDESEFAFVNENGKPVGGINGANGTSNSTTGTSTPSSTSTKLLKPSTGKPDTSSPSLPSAPPASRTSPQPADVDAAFTHPVDIFIHSGANMCFGILLLFLSMVPPAFSRLLYVIGFQGDRNRGVRLLWQSTKFDNINGSVAGLVLLSYYNASMAYCDIVPTPEDAQKLAGPDEIVGYPRERCKALLAQMRTLYPDSMLWRLEEARAMASNRHGEEAIVMLLQEKPGRMRQITALAKFELALGAMCTMNWTLMRDAFVQCVELNDWSHALYYYCAGCAELELYRDAFHADEAEKAGKAAQAAKHKKAAEGYFRLAPTVAGKKKFMARQMPMEAFVTRKLAKWEERAKALGVDLADAVGASPAQEMIYLWNGNKRMADKFLKRALGYLRWERCTAGARAVAAFQAAPDESAIASVCEASLLRLMGRIDEARSLLDRKVLSHDRALFKGPTKDDYPPAAAHHEMAAMLWQEANSPDKFPVEASEVDAYRRKKVDECQASLDKVVKWDSFLLDARIGMKVQTGLDTIRWLKEKKGWS